jgi:hypothetical protein
MIRISLDQAKQYKVYFRTNKHSNPQFYTIEDIDDGWSKVTYYQE